MEKLNGSIILHTSNGLSIMHTPALKNRTVHENCSPGFIKSSSKIYARSFVRALSAGEFLLFTLPITSQCNVRGGTAKNHGICKCPLAQSALIASSNIYRILLLHPVISGSPATREPIRGAGNFRMSESAARLQESSAEYFRRQVDLQS